MEDEIVQLRAQLRKHLGQRRALREQVNSQYPPLTRLPLDIISEIFMATFPEGDTDSWGRATPLLLGSICCMWRDVAWSMPWLWRTIRMDVVRRYHMSGARYRDYDSPPISPLLDCLSAPALRDLSIHAESDGISPPTN